MIFFPTFIVDVGGGMISEGCGLQECLEGSSG
jgi:hypothetical protein